MRATQRLAAVEALQGFDAQGKLPAGQRALGEDASGTQTFQVLRQPNTTSCAATKHPFTGCFTT